MKKISFLRMFVISLLGFGADLLIQYPGPAADDL